MADLRLVAGLGNPGPQYIDTRHNIGFMVIDCLAGKKGMTFSRSAAWSSALGKWGDILLIKPLTYMNRSGDVSWPIRALLQDPAGRDPGRG